MILGKRDEEKMLKTFATVVDPISAPGKANAYMRILAQAPRYK